MSHIYWNKKEIPRPDGSYVNHSDGRVFIMTDTGGKYKKRQVIGHATSDTMMHPNDLFRFLYPQLWKEHYGDSELPEHQLKVGVYAALLGIGYKTSLYPILIDVYGPLSANAIMDYAMYSILDRSDSTSLFEDEMSGHVIFSKKAYSDSWYSDFFSSGMSEDQNRVFRFQWLEECARRGVKKTWQSIDGSNIDCNATESDLSAPGKAKSRTNSNLVSFIWSVDAETGMPVLYQVNHGGMVDSKAFIEIALTLHTSGIKMEGAIIDRGFATYNVLKTLEECGFSYVMMLKSDTYGHQCMMDDYAQDLFWNAEYCINGKGMFGVSALKQVFSSHPETAYINLYFDLSNASGRALTLIADVWNAMTEGNRAIESGKEPVIPSNLAQYLEVVEDGNSRKVKIIARNMTTGMISKGYSSIASSEDFGPEVVDHLYNLRSSSETQFMIMKSQMGYDAVRVHTTPRILNRFAVCFVTAIIRHEIQSACKSFGYDTNKMIQELDRLVIELMPDGSYKDIQNLSERHKNLLKCFGILPEHFKFFAEECNRRMTNPVHSQIHILPDEAKGRKKKGGRPSKPKAESEEPKRGPGRPKGSKNKRTLEREAAAQSTETPEEPKRGPGRPKGSKNKKTLEREAAARAAEAAETREKRGPGRPKGSKNKTPEEKEASARLKRKRGRPKGSKNKKTLEREKNAPKRKPGRPKGSKNKKKQS